VTYTVKLFTPEGATDAQRASAERRFRDALESALGGAQWVWPVYSAYRQLVLRYGIQPDMEALTVEERTVFEHWQQAEGAALAAVFGPHRYLDEGGYDIEAA